MNKMQKTINKEIERNIALPTNIIKNKVLNVLIDMFVHVTETKQVNHNLLSQKRDLKMIKSAGGSVYNVL